MKTFLTILFLFILSVGFSKNHRDKVLKIKQYDYFDFLDNYGKDDTSIVIIDYFLKKRMENGLGEMSILPLTGVVALVVPPIGLVLSAVAFPVFIHGSYTYLKFSNKRLARVLTKYNNGGGLSKRLTKKIKSHFQSMHDETAQKTLY